MKNVWMKVLSVAALSALAAGTAMASGDVVTSFSLVDATTGEVISGYSPIENNSTIYLGSLPTKSLSIKANTSPATVGSVEFVLDSSYSHTENLTPYTLCGKINSESDYVCSQLDSSGAHTLKGIAYTGAKLTGTAGTPYQISFTISQSAKPTSSSHATRPSYNTGDGFFVLNGKLYDANGNEFRMRGVDRAHYDSNVAGIVKSNANTVRIFESTSWGWTFPELAKGVQTDHIDNNQVPIPTAPSTTTAVVGSVCTGLKATSTATSGCVDPNVLSDVVAKSWVAEASIWTPLNKWAIFNIANEWGPKNSAVWASSYITAVKQMRAAGYLGTLLIDSGGGGQDELDLTNYAAQVLAADSQHNLVFSYHLYGGTTALQSVVKSVSGKVITLNSSAAIHPFTSGYNGTNNSYSGITQMVIKSASGALTTIPVLQNVGGKPGAWTVTATATLPTIASGSVIYDWNNYQLRIPRLAALALKGVVVVIGEFGPGRNIGPSPTMVTPLEVVATAEANDVPWIAWAWDDNHLPGQPNGSDANNDWFSMSYFDGAYTAESQLTLFGQQMAEGCTNPTPGGCGCTEYPPMDQLTAAQLALAAPGCSGKYEPQYQPLSLKLATPASIFSK